MALDYQKLVEVNIYDLKAYRGMREPKNYPDIIMFRLFSDLYGISVVWDFTFRQTQKGAIKDTYENINSYLWQQYHQDQRDSKKGYRRAYDSGTQFGNISPSQLKKTMKGAKKNDEKCIEELEFTFVVRRPIRDFFIDYLTYILLGYYSEHAYEKLVNNIALPSKNWGGFYEMFECIASTVLMEISGVENSTGKKLTESLYKPLPPYCSSTITKVNFLKKWEAHFRDFFNHPH